MKAQRVFGMLLIAAQAGMMAYLTGAVAFPVSVMSLTMLGLVSTTRISLTRERGFRLAAGLAVALIIKYRLAPPDLPYDALFIRTQLAHVIAQYVLVMQVVQFFLERDDDRLPLSLPAWAAVGMVLASDVQIRNDQRTVCQALALLYVASTALFLAAARRPTMVRASNPPHRLARNVSPLLFLLAVCTTAWLSSSLLFRNERRIEIFIIELLAGQRAATPGFSATARLGDVSSWRNHRNREIAIRVVSEVAPGYLRGRAFESYRLGEWRAESESTVLHAQPDPPAPYTPRTRDELVFRYGTEYPDQPIAMQCWRRQTYEGTLFAPLQTSVIRAEINELWVSAHGLFRSTNLPAVYPYDVFVPREPPGTPAPLPDERRQRLLRVSRYLEWDPDVTALVERVFAGCETPRDKIAAVERHFHANYTYELRPDSGMSMDPLKWFLLEADAGHCEYFASGAAILLRLAGVPCRYVTGFVVTERNAYGGDWVARNRDAHAWIEAFDDRRGWVLVEATPAAGVPSVESAAPVSRFAQMSEYLQARWQTFKVEFGRGGFAWAAERVTGFLSSGPGLSLSVGLIGVVFWRFRRYLRRPSRPQRDLRFRNWHRALARMDQRLRRLGFERDAGETLHQFADRLARAGHESVAGRASGWYRRYAERRYGALSAAGTMPPDFPTDAA